MKIIGLLLTVVLLLGCSMSSARSVATNPMTVTEKSNFQAQLDAVATKHGGKAVILDNVDPSSINPKLKFDTIEDFDKALGTLTIKPAKPKFGNIIFPQ